MQNNNKQKVAYELYKEQLAFFGYDINDYIVINMAHYENHKIIYKKPIIKITEKGFLSNQTLHNYVESISLLNYHKTNLATLTEINKYKLTAVNNLLDKI